MLLEAGRQGGVLENDERYNTCSQFAICPLELAAGDVDHATRLLWYTSGAKF